MQPQEVRMDDPTRWDLVPLGFFIPVVSQTVRNMNALVNLAATFVREQ